MYCSKCGNKGEINEDVMKNHDTNIDLKKDAFNIKTESKIELTNVGIETGNPSIIENNYDSIGSLQNKSNVNDKNKLNLYIFIALMLIILITLSSCGDSSTDTYSDSNSDNYSYSDSDTEETAEDDFEEDVVEDDTATIGEKNALQEAKDYLNYSAFSYTGLIEQLEYEGYSNDEATYGVSNCDADWDEQAVMMATEYMDYSSFSRQGLIDQLKYEGFTTKQATYGVEANGY